MGINGDNVRERRVRMELRRLRDEAGYTVRQVAGRVGISATKLSRMETGDRPLNTDDLAALLGCYGAPRPLRQALLTLAREARAPGWWDQGERHLHDDLQFWIELEHDTASLRNYEQLLVPGLLQTAAYARAVIEGYGVPLPESEVAERVAARVERQRLLDRTDGFRLHVLLHEAALHTAVGGTAVMRGQLAHLVDAAERPTVTLQVVPQSAGAHPGLGDGPFAILDYRSLPSLVHLENKVSSLFLEERTQVETYIVAFNEILAVAYGPTDSVELIRATVAQPAVPEGVP